MAALHNAANLDDPNAIPVPPPDYDWKQHRKYVLFMMFITYFLNSVDRNIINILAQSIKTEFGLADWQLGVMTGFAFATFYNIIGIPTARFIDGGAVRRNIIAGGLALWSVATALCGAAQNFWQLLAARAGVGVGEGTFGPSVVTLVSDYYGRSERARAIAIYLLGLPIAALVGMPLGGWIAEHYGWRVALMVVGLPGVIVALIVRYTIKEPPRGLSDGKFVKVQSALPIMQVFRTMTKKKTVVYMLIAVGFASFATVGGSTTWFPPYLQRTFGMSTAALGTSWGIITGITGALGSFGAGWLVDKYSAKHPKFFLIFPALAMALAFPFYVAATLAGNFYLSIAFLLVPATLNNSWIPAALATTQGLAPLAMRALLGMFVTFAANLIGHGFSPPIIGAISDLFSSYVGSPVEGLRWALIVTAMLYPVAALFFWMASRTVQGDLEQ
jgi:predicted MFS family arabinose efflux permease